jgi:hypothetical protein
VSQVVAHAERLVLRPLTPIDAAAATREPGLLDDDVQQNQSWIQTWSLSSSATLAWGYWGCWRGADERFVGFCAGTLAERGRVS